MSTVGKFVVALRTEDAIQRYSKAFKLRNSSVDDPISIFSNMAGGQVKGMFPVQCRLYPGYGVHK